MRLAHPRAVVLQPAVNLERIFVVEANVIELRDRQILALPPFAPAVVGIPNAAVIPGHDRLRVGRIDPDIVHIAVAALETADDGKAFARVFAQNQWAVGLEDAVRIFRIDDQVREIERTPDHPVALVAFVPRRAGVIGNEERAVSGFDKTINALRI